MNNDKTKQAEYSVQQLNSPFFPSGRSTTVFRSPPTTPTTSTPQISAFFDEASGTLEITEGEEFIGQPNKIIDRRNATENDTTVKISKTANNVNTASTPAIPSPPALPTTLGITSRTNPSLESTGATPKHKKKVADRPPTPNRHVTFSDVIPAGNTTLCNARPTVSTPSQHNNTQYMETVNMNKTGASYSLNDCNQRQNCTLGNLYEPDRAPAIPKFVAPSTFDPQLDDICEFIRVYENTAISNNWDAALKLRHFGNYLQGQAQKWFRTFALRNRDADWAATLREFKLEFLYAEKKEETALRLIYRRQRTDEPLINYLRDILYLCDQVDPNMSDQLRRQHFERGLVYKYRIKIGEQRPQSFQEVQDIVKTIHAVEIQAKQADEVANAALGYTGSQETSTPVLNEHRMATLIREEVTRAISSLSLGERKDNRPQGDRRNGNDRRNYNRSQNFSPGCFNCGNPNHISRFCYQPRRNGYNNSRPTQGPPQWNRAYRGQEPRQGISGRQQQNNTYINNNDTRSVPQDRTQENFEGRRY